MQSHSQPPPSPSQPRQVTHCHLVLASASPYRRALLHRLQIPFDHRNAAIDESLLPGEDPTTAARRLAAAKAAAVARALDPIPTSGNDSGAMRIVIGSDQIAVRDGGVLGKPGDVDSAIAQLESCSGKRVNFLTAVTALREPDGASLAHVDSTVVEFRPLSGTEIRRYVASEPALDCAGSFKAEALGISLFESIESDDPTGLLGLPLIAVARMLRQLGLAVP